MADDAPKTEDRPADDRMPKARSKMVPILCNIFGTLLLVGVIVLTVPLSVPRIRGYQVYAVVSGSMEPEIPMGSVVYVFPGEPADAEVDDVIAFYREESVIVHRVTANRTSVGEFATKGDANKEEDPDPVPYDAYIGIVERSIPALGQFMSLYASTVGKIYLLIAAACGVMLNILASRMRAVRRAQILRALVEAKLAGEAAQAAGVSDVDSVTLDPSLVDAAFEEADAPRRRRARIRNIIMAILALIFIGSAGVVGFVTYQRVENDRIYNEAADRFREDASDVEDKEDTIAPIKVDFDDLRSVNEDVVGWLYCEGTSIDYPVLHGETNKEYLRNDYTRSYNMNGSIFVDCDNHPGFVDANTIIYGHHMNHGAMFGDLEAWGEQDYYEKHRVMWLLTPEQDYQVVLVSGHHTSAYSNMYDLYFDHDQKFQRFLDEAVEESDFKPVDDATVNPDRNYVMLTTCAYIFDNARYVLHGKLVPVNSAGGYPKN